MGGFAGGDEAGFWDEETSPKSIRKQKKNKEKSYIEVTDSGYSIKAYARNITFVKETDSFRCVRIEDMYDTVSFVACTCEDFTLEGCDDISLESNTIYKAYQALAEYTIDSDIVDFFHEHKIVVNKQIPIGSGMGGGSSDAAAFMRLVKEVCNLMLSTSELVKIGKDIKADIPFFIYNYPSATIISSGKVIESE